jgi:hypothetical protein
MLELIYGRSTSMPDPDQVVTKSGISVPARPLLRLIDPLSSRARPSLFARIYKAQSRETRARSSPTDRLSRSHLSSDSHPRSVACFRLRLIYIRPPPSKRATALAQHGRAREETVAFELDRLCRCSRKSQGWSPSLHGARREPSPLRNHDDRYIWYVLLPCLLPYRGSSAHRACFFSIPSREYNQH